MIALVLAVLAGCSDADGVLAGLSSTNPAVREGAVLEAADISDDRVTKQLIVLLDDPDARIRRDAAEALAQIKDVQAVPALSKHVQDADADVSRAAIDALGRIGDPAAGPALIAVLQAHAAGEGAGEAAGTARTVPLNAIWALGACHVTTAEPLLASLRAHDDPWVRFNADAALLALSGS